jgi:hypothetical protein
MRDVRGMAVFGRTGLAAIACVGVLGAVGVAGFAAGFWARAGSRSADFSDMSAAAAVSFRFPNDWTQEDSPAPAPFAVASADASFTLFDPNPLYPLRTETSPPIPAEAEEPPAPSAQALAVGSVKTPLPRPLRHSNRVLNEQQIASIKQRLNLTPEQQRYWPAVEAELRKMEYKKDQKSPGSRTAAIDMSKMNVEGLKSAGYPLIMSFNDDQRRELQSLAHLLGLESMVSSF